MQFKKGSILNGRYEILNPLGEGGFGLVLHAMDLELGREVALKIQKYSAIDTKKDVLRFQREAKLLAQLLHPNIMRVYTIDLLEDGRPLIAMEFLEGKSLSAHLNEKASGLKGDECLSIFMQICRGLIYAHSEGIVHRDLSPANIFLLGEGSNTKVKIIDFGLAKLFENRGDSPLQLETLTSTGALIGNPNYMSPEACRGEKTDSVSDIYALGCILYEMLSGMRAFESSNSMVYLHLHQNEYPEEPRFSWGKPEMEAAFRNITLKCLQKNKDKRFQSINEILLPLEQNLSNETSAKLQVFADSKLDKWSEKRRLSSSDRRQSAFALLWSSKVAKSLLALFFILATVEFLFLGSLLGKISDAEQTAKQQYKFAAVLEAIANGSDDLRKLYAGIETVFLEKKQVDLNAFGEKYRSGESKLKTALQDAGLDPQLLAITNNETKLYEEVLTKVFYSGGDDLGKNFRKLLEFSDSSVTRSMTQMQVLEDIIQKKSVDKSYLTLSYLLSWAATSIVLLVISIVIVNRVFNKSNEAQIRNTFMALLIGSFLIQSCFLVFLQQKSVEIAQSMKNYAGKREFLAKSHDLVLAQLAWSNRFMDSMAYTVMGGEAESANKISKFLTGDALDATTAPGSEEMRSYKPYQKRLAAVIKQAEGLQNLVSDRSNAAKRLQTISTSLKHIYKMLEKLIESGAQLSVIESQTTYLKIYKRHNQVTNLQWELSQIGRKDLLFALKLSDNARRELLSATFFLIVVNAVVLLLALLLSLRLAQKLPSSLVEARNQSGTSAPRKADPSQENII